MVLVKNRIIVNGIDWIDFSTVKYTSIIKFCINHFALDGKESYAGNFCGSICQDGLSAK